MIKVNDSFSITRYVRRYAAGARLQSSCHRKTVCHDNCAPTIFLAQNLNKSTVFICRGDFFFISLRNFYVNFLESINGLLNEVSRFHLFEYEDIVRPRNVINFWWIDSKLNIFSKEQHLSGSNGTIERARHTNSSNLSYVDFFLFLERKKCYFERSIRRDNRQTAN